MLLFTLLDLDWSHQEAERETPAAGEGGGGPTGVLSTSLGGGFGYTPSK